METFTSLNEHEQAIIGAHRQALDNARETTQRVASADMHGELASIYDELNEVTGSSWEEQVREIRERIYGLLY